MKTLYLRAKKDAFLKTQFPVLRTIKYSGNKARMLPVIVWIADKILKPGCRVLDLMAGTHCVGYALKQRYQIFSNDIQEYSFIIGKAFIENGGYSINRELAEKELMGKIKENQRTKEFNLFQTTYPDTYFTASQCEDIDNIRAAIESVRTPQKELYLTILMSVMCYTSNTTGHFAEYLKRPQSNQRSIEKLFFQKCENRFVESNSYKNTVFNHDYKDLLLGADQELIDVLEGSHLIYLDPPFSPAQYSRFYHLLETLVKYDYPQVEYKGRYRKDRHFSDFCRKSTAQSEMEFALEAMSETCKGYVLLSYVDSRSCLIPEENIKEIVESNFSHSTKPLRFPVSHSRLGNGLSRNVMEYLILATNTRNGSSLIRKVDGYWS